MNEIMFRCTWCQTEVKETQLACDYCHNPLFEIIKRKEGEI